MKAYSLILQTVIAMALCAITAKLYLPQADAIGVHLGAPTQNDFDALRQGAESTERSMAFKELARRIPLTRVHGEVAISQPVEVSGSVSIEH